MRSNYLEWMLIAQVLLTVPRQLEPETAVTKENGFKVTLKSSAYILSGVFAPLAFLYFSSYPKYRGACWVLENDFHPWFYWRNKWWMLCQLMLSSTPCFLFFPLASVCHNQIFSATKYCHSEWFATYNLTQGSIDHYLLLANNRKSNSNWLKYKDLYFPLQQEV